MVFDSGALQQDAIRKGVFVGSVTQDPVQIGYQAVKLAIASAKGETVKDVDTGSNGMMLQISIKKISKHYYMNKI